MKIESLFTKDLFRPINGVVKVDEQDERVVWQELDEYVVTRELDKHFRSFFGAYLAAVDDKREAATSGRMGVWVSGFFGSGKSHFIKILSYLLAERAAHAPETHAERRASEFFDSKIKDPLFLADIKRAVRGATDVVLFNIDSKATKREDGNAILDVFLRVFNEMQGFHPDAPHIADMERRLAERNQLERFQQAFRAASGSDWLEERDAYLLMGEYIVQALGQTLGISGADATKWFERAEAEHTISIDKFARLVNEYLERKAPDHRIVFIVDEVGQFVGTDTHRMLNLQTITEDLGRLCQGRAWVIVTSQEDIDAVLGEVNRARNNDFSKIQGRFTTRLSLSSSNTDEVIQARLLGKTAEARHELENLFAVKGDILKNQLSFADTGATLKTYRDSEDFVVNYPFAPYHFQLVQRIFESIRRVGATGLHLSRGERSMLDAFQSAARRIADKETGALVPLYEFYPAIESSLDTAVKRTIDQTADNPSLEKFDGQLLRVLFLIRYVDNFKSDLDSLVTLCIDEADADRLALRKLIEASLQRLEKETLIARNGDVFFFLTNEEQDVSREIKNVDVSAGEQAKRLADQIFDDVLRDAGKLRYAANREDYSFNRLCDGYTAGTRADADLTLEIISPLNEDYALFNPARCVAHSTEGNGRVVVRLANERTLGEELRTLLQTDKYVRAKTDASAPDTTKRILRDRQEENRERTARLTALLDRLISEADIYAAGQSLTLPPNMSARQRVAEAQSYLVKNVFTKLDYIQVTHDEPQAEIKAILTSDDTAQNRLSITLEETSHAAVREIRAFVELSAASNQRVTLDELATRFNKRPFGWRPWETVLLVARMFVAGELTLMIEGASIEPRASVEALTKNARWRGVTILKRRSIGAAELQQSRALGQRVFSQIGPETEDALHSFLRDELGKWREKLVRFESLAEAGGYPGRVEAAEGLAAVAKLLAVRDSYDFFREFKQGDADLEDLSDTVAQLDGFFANQRQTWDKLRAAASGSFQSNRDVLKNDADAALSLLRIDEIIAAPRPYAMLHETDRLIEIISRVNDRHVAEHRARGEAFVDEKIAAIKAALEALKTDADFSNENLKPLQDVKRRLTSETSIPAFFYHSDAVTRAAESALEAIETRRDPPETAKPQKSVRVVKPAQVTTKYYLETAADVDDYLARLKDALLSALSDDARIRLQ